MKNEIQMTHGYLDALNQAKELVAKSQERFLRSANRISMELRFGIGKIIDENSVKYDWGKSVLENFAKDLVLGFPNATGFSARNLSSMRQFYNEYNQQPELFELAKEVSWRANIAIMAKVKDSQARLFYLRMASESMCSSDVIITQISSQAYERECLKNKKHNFITTLPRVQAAKAENMLKSSYFFETTEALALTNPLQEKQIEDDMVCRIKEVIMMLGRGFSFIGNQYVLNAGENTYRIDLLFFNRITLSLVAVELKLTAFKAEYAGKMSLYLKLLDETVKLPNENNSIGLILCANRNDVEVDYVLPEINKPIGVAELKFSKILPVELSGKLPDPDLLKVKILQNIPFVNEDPKFSALT